MDLLRILKESDHCQGVSLHFGMGWSYVDNEHLEKIILHYKETGENLIDAYRHTIAWNNSDYVNYMVSGDRLDDVDRSEIASSIAKTRSLNVFPIDYIRNAIANTKKICHNVRSRKKNKVKTRRNRADKYISREDVRQKVFDLHGDCCLNCGSDVQICLDHIVPVSRGGEDKIDNLQPLCFSCNSSKGTKTIDYRDNEQN